ncbi:MAG: sulfatase-like hydrolase/transferase [Sedimentisphaerales bacterium]|nr:sulfatase-like hydrolase/transferase [Sedimentisphaerales bacterium]
MQNRRDFMKVIGLGAAAMALPNCSGSAQRKPKPSVGKKPNIVLIMTDDQGWGDIHSHGNPEIDTPVMDRLAASGVRFDRFYVSPVCAPTRASLLTGRYHERTGVHGVTRGYETMRSTEVTLAEILRQASYVTGCFGKWHNGAHYPYHPNGRGFDEFFGFCAGHWNNYFDTSLEHNGQLVKTKGYITDVLTDSAIKFIKNNRNRPFFCYLPYNAPHSPWQVPDKYFKKYKDRGLGDTTACAYAMCENLDDNLGRLFNKIGQLNLTENTIVLFLTDNGPNSNRFNGNMKGCKGSCNEGGIRVPPFIRWPARIKAGTQVKEIAAHIDLLPTIVELTGVKMPQTLPLDGVSLVPLLEGKTTNWPERMLYAHWSSRGSVRTQRWRATIAGNKSCELYDMIADPSQKKDVAKQYPHVAKELLAAYENWFREVTKDGFESIPIPIGYEQRPEVVLPSHEAFLEPNNRQGISYVGRSGWANDWITNWTSTAAYPFWEIEVVRPGRYEITLMYVCPKQDVGAKLRVEIGGKTLEGVIEKAHNPDHIHSPDRVARIEVFEKVWAPLKLGTVTLQKGRTRLCVKALTKPGRTVMDLKAVHISRLD